MQQNFLLEMKTNLIPRLEILPENCDGSKLILGELAPIRYDPFGFGEDFAGRLYGHVLDPKTGEPLWLIFNDVAYDSVSIESIELWRSAPFLLRINDKYVCVRDVKNSEGQSFRELLESMRCRNRCNVAS